jgi:hypothetical protein
MEVKQATGYGVKTVKQHLRYGLEGVLFSL